jgi:hypothetical protein
MRVVASQRVVTRPAMAGSPSTTARSADRAALSCASDRAKGNFRILLLFTVLLRCAGGDPRNVSFSFEFPFQEFAQDVEGQHRLHAVNDLPLQERGPEGLADDRDVLDLLAFHLVLLFRPLLPGRRLLYSIVVFIYTHFVYKTLRNNELVRACRSEFNAAMFLICYFACHEFADRFRIH